MSHRTGRGGLGFGGAVGLGVAVALLVTVIAIGRALARQLTGALSLVITFAEVAACTVLGAVTLAVIGLLVYRGQLARIHLAERQVQLEQLAEGTRQAVRAEVLEAGAEALPQGDAQARGALPAARSVPTREMPATTGNTPWTVPTWTARGDR